MTDRADLNEQLRRIFKDAFVRFAATRDAAIEQLLDGEVPVMAHRTRLVVVNDDWRWSNQGGRVDGPRLLLTNQRLIAIGFAPSLWKAPRPVFRSLRVSQISEVPDLPTVLFATLTNSRWPLQDSTGQIFDISLTGTAKTSPLLRRHALAFVSAVRAGSRVPRIESL